MTLDFRPLCLSLAALCLAAAPATAQNITGNDLTLSGDITQNGFGPNFFGAANNIFDGRACIGPACDGTEPFEQGPLRLKWSEPDILFEDSSSSGGISSNDWRLVINDTGITKFAVQDIDGGSIPFTIEGGVRDNALWLDSSDRIGMGTTIPQNSLHIVGDDSPGIMLQQTGGFGNQRWEMIGNETSFVIRDSDSNTLPFVIDDQAPDDALVVEDTGEIGIGTGNPTAPMHIRRNNNTARLLVEDTGSSGAQELFKLSNNGGSYFTFENTSAGTTWFFTHENSAPNRFIIADAVADGPEFSLNADGDVTIPGNFISGSTTLNVPDYVFADDYALRPLSEVQAFIDAHSHLPDVPSAAQIAEDGLDMTAMQMTMLKKIEELTLYTLELEATNRAQARELARLGTLETRLTRIEAALAAE
ncbi:hypothetical protein DU478_20585 [Thalassococcus profundi]|uniref:Uncharacterized protein n=1 Tax=Thalassococcus profundi TaxID=2282382 RepID=A0A369TN75_9RHOB|nr:hypothetical protein [Thalassococcus profundi]RDD64396.1 hypothetical protein DU478_20585 [Thalassococcus profundi]